MKKVTMIFLYLRQKYIEIPYSQAHEQYQGNDMVFCLLPDMGENAAKIKNIGIPSKSEAVVSDIVILRKMTDNDLVKLQEREEEAKKDFQIFRDKIIEKKLPMRPVSASISFYGDLFMGTFVADERVDFRELVRDLSALISKRVFFEQVGSRDRARIVGILGKCGQMQCCKRHLQFLSSVTMESARVQNLSVQQLENLTGVCGKLKCCLNFEVDFYREQQKGLPKLRKKVIVNGREGRVCSVDILNKKVKIKFDDTKDVVIVEASQIDSIKNG